MARSRSGPDPGVHRRRVPPATPPPTGLAPPSPLWDVMTSRPVAPLYDPRFEHDSCGVGFVADAGRHSGRRVLPLALAGLAALRHRGAVAADGESGDGAGVLLPLSASVRRLVGLGASNGGVVAAMLPRRRAELAAAVRMVESSLAAEGLGEVRGRTVPVRVSVLGATARRSRPHLAQAIVRRPSGWPTSRLELALLLARRRAESAARDAGLADFAIASASSRTLVYKALGSGDRLAALYPHLPRAPAVPFAIFHQRFATNTHPTWALAQPFRWLAHNGEINTVRGNREQVRGRSGDRAPTEVSRRLLAAGPLLSPDGSDSLSLDEALEALVATGWRIDTALLSLVPDAPGLRRAAYPSTPDEAASAVLAPWDGPGAFVFSDGRRVGALTDRNGLRPLAYAVTEERLVAAASEAGAIPIATSETIRRGRLGPGELLVVDPRRGLVLEDTDAKRAAAVTRAAPSARVHPTPLRLPEREPAATTPLPVRYVAGLDAERLRLAIRTMALEGHEPLWSMGDDTPTPARAAIGRPVADHLRQSFAQVTNPPIDPDRERVVVDLSVALGPTRPLLGGPRSGSPRHSVGFSRPVVAELDGALAALPPRTVRRLDATWDPRSGPDGLEQRLGALASAAVRAS